MDLPKFEILVEICSLLVSFCRDESTSNPQAVYSVFFDLIIMRVFTVLIGFAIVC